MERRGRSTQTSTNRNQSNITWQAGGPLKKDIQQLCCGNCGAVTTAGRSFCSRCGSQIITPTRIQTSSSQGYVPAAARTEVCRNCGAAALSSYRFCRKCGSDLESSATQEGSVRTYTPQAIARMLRNLRNKDRSRYMNLVENVVMVDSQGRYWSIGAETSKWYLLEKGRWIAEQPTGPMRMKRRSELTMQVNERVVQNKPIRSSARVCPSCSRPVKPSQLFCIECGSRLTPVGS